MHCSNPKLIFSNVYPLSLRRCSLGHLRKNWEKLGATKNDVEYRRINTQTGVILLFGLPGSNGRTQSWSNLKSRTSLRQMEATDIYIYIYTRALSLNWRTSILSCGKKVILPQLLLKIEQIDLVSVPETLKRRRPLLLSPHKPAPLFHCCVCIRTSLRGWFLNSFTHRFTVASRLRCLVWK